MEYQVGDKAHDQVGGENHDQIGKVSRELVGKESHYQVSDEADDQVGDEPHDHVSDETHDGVGDEVHGNVEVGKFNVASSSQKIIVLAGIMSLLYCFVYVMLSMNHMFLLTIFDCCANLSRCFCICLSASLSITVCLVTKHAPLRQFVIE